MVSISINDELEGASTPLSLDTLPQSDLVAMVKVHANSIVEQAVVYSTSTTGLSTLTFRERCCWWWWSGREERSDVLHRGRYIYILQDA